MKLNAAELLANGLMQKHGLTAKGWTFAFDNAKRRFGYCQYRPKRISLSKELTELNSLEQVTDTILHEIAHALAGSRAGHYAKWRYTAMSIGAKPQRCYDSTVIKPAHKWVGTCPGCGVETKRMKRMRVACSRCCTAHNNGKFTVDYLFVWTPNTELAAV